MIRKTEAEIFIQTLTEVWEEDCRRKNERLRYHLRESVKRFVEEFHAGARAKRRPKNWLPRGAPPAPSGTRQAVIGLGASAPIQE